jgi:hypothetical protein
LVVVNRTDTRRPKNTSLAPNVSIWERCVGKQFSISVQGDALGFPDFLGSICCEFLNARGRAKATQIVCWFRVHITGQLIDAATQHHIWADRSEGNLEDVLARQDSVTACVIGAIEPSLRTAEILRSPQQSRCLRLLPSCDYRRL